MLPSERHALRFWLKGPAAAAPGLVVDVVERAAVIAAGLYLAGHRPRNIWWHAFGGSAALEVFVLIYAGLELKRSPAAKLQKMARRFGWAS